MNKEEFKNYVNEIAKNELRNSFDNNLMETLNSAFIFKYVDTLEKENKQLKENWNKLKKELKDKFEEFRYVEDECLRTMAQEDDSILFSMSCIERGDK